MVPLDLLSGLDTRTKFIATTLGAMTCCVLLLQKLLSTKEALEYTVLAHTTLYRETSDKQRRSVNLR